MANHTGEPKDVEQEQQAEPEPPKAEPVKPVNPSARPIGKPYKQQ